MIIFLCEGYIIEQRRGGLIAASEEETWVGSTKENYHHSRA